MRQKKKAFSGDKARFRVLSVRKIRSRIRSILFRLLTYGYSIFVEKHGGEVFTWICGYLLHTILHQIVKHPATSIPILVI